MEISEEQQYVDEAIKMTKAELLESLERYAPAHDKVQEKGIKKITKNELEMLYVEMCME